MLHQELDQLAGADHARLRPSAGKMTLIAGNEVIGFSSLGAFEKNVVVRVSAGGDGLDGRNDLSRIPNALERERCLTGVNRQVRAADYIFILGQNRFRDTKLNLLVQRKIENRLW